MGPEDVAAQVEAAVAHVLVLPVHSAVYTALHGQSLGLRETIFNLLLVSDFSGIS